MRKARIGDTHKGLKKLREEYCSLPKFIPTIVREYVETRCWWVCKIHDNQVGERTKVSLFIAHWNFVKGIILDSKLAWVLRPLLVLFALPIIIWRGHGK